MKEQIQLFYKYRKQGINIDNQSRSSKSILNLIKSGHLHFGDMSNQFPNNNNAEFILEYVSTWRSIYSFKLKKINSNDDFHLSIDIQRGNLGNLRPIYNVSKEN